MQLYTYLIYLWVVAVEVATSQALPQKRRWPPGTLDQRAEFMLHCGITVVIGLHMGANPEPLHLNTDSVLLLPLNLIYLRDSS